MILNFLVKSLLFFLYYTYTVVVAVAKSVILIFRIDFCILEWKKKYSATIMESREFVEPGLKEFKAAKF